MERKPTMELELITPERAVDYLQLNDRNRHVTDSRVQYYATLLRNGEWHILNDAITFDWDGKLINGQHRLMAIISTRIAATCWVMYGADPITFEHMDHGKSRDAADVLSARGFVNAHALASSLGWLYRIEQDKVYVGLKERMTPAVFDAIHTRYPEIVASVAMMASPAKRAARLLKSGAMAAAFHVMFARAAGESRATDFFLALANGEGLERGNPIYALRERLLTNHTARVPLPQAEIATYLVRAWNAWIGEKELTMFKGRVLDTAFPDIQREPRKKDR